MNWEFRFNIILEGEAVRNALSFYEVQLDSLTIWACYPLPIHQMRTIPTPPYGCGKTPDLAFQDLYLKLNPGIVELNTEEFNAAISHQCNAG